MSKRILLGVTLFLLLALAWPASAQEVTDDEVNDVARDLYCPVCENTPLDVCPTQACQDWRDIIRTQLAEGKSEAEIQQYFVGQYGARVLAEPPREGFNVIIWLLPVAAVVIGAVFLGRYFAEIRSRRPEAEGTAEASAPRVTVSDAGQPEPQRDEYVARVEKELRER